MNLINTSGSVLLGPGSEWFWSMAQFFAVVITLLGIYRQLKAQGAANALQKMQFLSDRYSSERLTHARVVAAIQLKHGKSRAGMEPAMVEVADFWETLGSLYADGHVRLRDIKSWSSSLQMWWALLRPSIEEERVAQGSPVYEYWERLDGLMRDFDASDGMRSGLDDDALPGIIDDVIHINTESLRMAKDVSLGVIPVAPAPVVASEPA